MEPEVSILHGASILITGGTGAFGRAFARRALDDGAARVAVLSRDEAKHATMAAYMDDSRLRYFVGDIRDERRVRMAAHGVDYVIHAAAMKRVEHCEGDPDEAVATNIIGTANVAHAAIAAGVKRAVLLSTDKAAAPCTLYGMTKATAERAWIAANGYADGRGTRLAVTRYGNVLGSTGSLLPLWRSQMRTRGELTMTDPTATRFWMTMDEAVELVVHALSEMQGGETFTKLIGAASLSELAAVVAPTVPCRITGLRVGEKLHETLVSEDELPRTLIGVDNYLLILPATASWPLYNPPAYVLSEYFDNFPNGIRSDSPIARFMHTDLQRLVAQCP